MLTSKTLTRFALRLLALSALGWLIVQATLPIAPWIPAWLDTRVGLVTIGDTLFLSSLFVAFVATYVLGAHAGREGK